MPIQPQIQLTPERFARGMTFEQYLAYIASPESLRREATGGARRRDYSGYLRERYQKFRLTEAQSATLKWLAEQPNGPARILLIAEEWSTDCRRDTPVLQHMAEAGGLELRIFTRDGDTHGAGPTPNPDAPNADLVSALLRHRGEESFLSIPMVAFVTRDFEPLYRYLEFPWIYRKDRVQGYLREQRPGETPEQAARRFSIEYPAMQAAPIFDVWAEAAVAEMISFLYERNLRGTLD